MKHTRPLLAIAVLLALLGLPPALSMAASLPAQPAQGGGNLLTNPGFEGLSCPGLPPCIRSGFRAVKLFTCGKIHNGGFYQVVSGL